MTQNKRIILAFVVLVIAVGIILGVNALRRQFAARLAPLDQATLPPGSIPIFVDGRLVGGFTPADLEQLEQVSFEDAEEGKTQEGWMLSDVLVLHVDGSTLAPAAAIAVSSSSRENAVSLTWGEVSDFDNMVMFDVSTSRGTLKLVSLLDRLDTRDEWIQDVDKIEITTE